MKLALLGTGMIVTEESLRSVRKPRQGRCCQEGL